MKTFRILCLTALFAAFFSLSAFASGWIQDSVGWRYLNENGNYLANGWMWLDGNSDGVAECYYFDANGYMLASTTTPDGYTVNADGAWIQDGSVVTRIVETASSGVENINSGSSSSVGYSTVSSGNSLSSSSSGSSGSSSQSSSSRSSGSSGSGSGSSVSSGKSSSSSVSSSTSSSSSGIYILNKSSKTIHIPSCASVKKMSDKNKATSSKSLSELLAAGYKKCKNCFK